MFTDITFSVTQENLDENASHFNNARFCPIAIAIRRLSIVKENIRIKVWYDGIEFFNPLYSDEHDYVDEYIHFNDEVPNAYRGIFSDEDELIPFTATLQFPNSVLK